MHGELRAGMGTIRTSQGERGLIQDHQRDERAATDSFLVHFYGIRARSAWYRSSLTDGQQEVAIDFATPVEFIFTSCLPTGPQG